MAPRNFRARDGQRRPHAHAVPAAQAGIRPPADLDALLALARESGLLVTLDGQIGREKYQSVAGSVLALQRFAAALCARADTATPVVPGTRRRTRPGWPRLRNRTPGTRGRLHGVHRRARICRGAGRRHDLRALRIT